MSQLYKNNRQDIWHIRALGKWMRTCPDNGSSIVCPCPPLTLTTAFRQLEHALLVIVKSALMKSIETSFVPPEPPSIPAEVTLPPLPTLPATLTVELTVRRDAPPAREVVDERAL